MARHRGLDLAHVDIHVITAPVLRLDRGADRARLLETTKRLRPRLLLLDPLVRLHGIDENHAGEVEAPSASSRRGPLPSAGLRRSLDSSLVTAPSHPTPTEKPEFLHHTRGNREEATGTVSCLKSTIDYLDQGAVNYRGHTHTAS
jgi:hypothetical protein